jgi:hypothetical protein
VHLFELFLLYFVLAACAMIVLLLLLLLQLLDEEHPLLEGAATAGRTEQTGAAYFFSQASRAVALELILLQLLLPISQRIRPLDIGDEYLFSWLNVLTGYDVESLPVEQLQGVWVALVV